jgi:hypothetical protein
MEKINTNEFKQVLKDVRSAYRLIALYQTRVKDVVKFIMDNYQLTYAGGYQKFSEKNIRDGQSAKLGNYTWDWLPMYMYQFTSQEFKIGSDHYCFHLYHVSDSGYFDQFGPALGPDRLNVTAFGPVEDAKTRLYFVLSRNDVRGLPYSKVLKNHLSAKSIDEISEGDWIAKPFEMQNFFNAESATEAMKDFDNFCFEQFSIRLIDRKFLNMHISE